MTTAQHTLGIRTRSASIALALAMAAGTCVAQDGAAASFERMLSHQPATHQPNAIAPALPSGSGPDLLVAALIEPLRDGHAGAAASQRLASTRR